MGNMRVSLNEFAIRGENLKNVRILRNKIYFSGEAWEEKGLEIHNRLQAFANVDRIKVKCVTGSGKKYTGYARIDKVNLPKFRVVPEAVKLSIILKYLFRFKCTMTKIK